ncbi:hypothetical protein [Streptomyces luteolus]|uniref:DUF5709 domain-containing protein n=1 Tax=Streptomyces luteolus TaxID=3043615 RepID=A0ABT6SN01_9ACTN|nr:hypothetical protein [Streptomyces sp. B-S-A12]MDI3416991.1 hypothetical protein [Streptomyces sp. B-S-A12]
MTVDPSDPETFDPEEPEADLDEETPEADAAEQHTDLRQERDEPLPHYDPSTANPADAAEQARVVDLDEDDYR